MAEPHALDVASATRLEYRWHCAEKDVRRVGAVGEEGEESVHSVEGGGGVGAEWRVEVEVVGAAEEEDVRGPADLHCAGC